MSLNDPISAIMSINPVVANPLNKFSQVLRLFSEFPVHHLPVVDGNNKLIGIISSSDLYKVFLTLSSRPEKISMDMDSLDRAINISEIMTPNPISISSGEPISKAVKVFAEKKFLSLPVVDNGQLIGILSMKDVIKYVSESL